MRAADRVTDVRRRRGVRPVLLNLAVALWMLALFNRSFWAALWQAAGGWQAPSLAWLATLPVFALAWVWLSLEGLTWGRLAKPVLCGLLVGAASIAYFMDRYGVVFDRDMLVNVMETDWAEVRDLLSPALFGWVVVLGIVPATAVALLPLERQGWRSWLLHKVVAMVIPVLMIGILAAAFFPAYASLLRNHRDLRLQFVPGNLLAAAHGYAKARLTPTPSLERVAADATRVAGAQRAGRPLVAVIVVGETTRAANLSLNGYGRATTPALAARAELINFGHAQACGTATATALPCMFLDLGRSGYKDGMAYRRENLLDVLRQAGLDVWWIENNSGCKGVCDRAKVLNAGVDAVAGSCSAGGCNDEVLLDALWMRLQDAEEDTVLVLHMKGQHGPAYHLRYPPEFERFTPVCSSNALDSCDRRAVVNAYDNAVVYTDHVLDWVITLLQAQSARLDAAMLFVSDHGESLGENGLFLHGMPYALAPKEQREVPWLAWLAPGVPLRLGLDPECLRKQRDSLSHDNLYHSVLGLVGARAGVYRADLDLTKPCAARAGQSSGPSALTTASAVLLPSRPSERKARDLPHPTMKEAS